MEVSLPDEKARELQILLEEWSGRRHCRKRELLSLIGKLAHACKVVRVGRLFLRRMLNLASQAKRLYHWVHRNTEFTITKEPAHCEAPGLAVARLEGIAVGLIKDNLAPSSQRAYESAQRSFIQFCSSLRLPMMPTTVQVLLLYVADISQRVCHVTARSYLAAICHMHLAAGLPDPLLHANRLSLAVKGLKRRKPRGNDTRLTNHTSHLELDRHFVGAACGTV